MVRLASSILASSLLAFEAQADGASGTAAAPCRAGSQAMARVELYLGTGRGDRGRERRAWHRFLADVVTPRFPEGLTIVDASGQWRSSQGLEHEASRILIILYRPDATSDQRIQAIRSAYKFRFGQRSVLRVDEAACVSF